MTDKGLLQRGSVKARGLHCVQKPFTLDAS